MSEEHITNEKLFHLLVEIKQQQHEAFECLKQIRNKMTDLDNAIAALQTEVANNTAVTNSAIPLIQALSQQLALAIAAAQQAGATPAQLGVLQTLLASLTANDTALNTVINAAVPASPGGGTTIAPAASAAATGSATKPLVK